MRQLYCVLASRALERTLPSIKVGGCAGAQLSDLQAAAEALAGAGCSRERWHPPLPPLPPLPVAACDLVEFSVHAEEARWTVRHAGCGSSPPRPIPLTLPSLSQELAQLEQGVGAVLGEVELELLCQGLRALAAGSLLRHDPATQRRLTSRCVRAPWAEQQRLHPCFKTNRGAAAQVVDVLGLISVGVACLPILPAPPGVPSVSALRSLMRQLRPLHSQHSHLSCGLRVRM